MGALTVGATLTGLGLTAAALDPPDAAGVSADGTLTGTAVDLAAAGLGAPVPVARIDTVPAAVPVGGIGAGAATGRAAGRTGVQPALARGGPVQPSLGRAAAALPVAANAPAVQVPSVQLPIVQAPTVQTPALLTTALETSSLQNSPVQPVVNQLSSVGSTVVPMVRNALPPAVTQPLAATGLLSSITPITPQSVASQPTLVNAPAPLPLPALPALAPVTSAAQALPSNVTALVHGVAGLL
ncbi:MAG TPA: hypothetical protein VGZ32_15950 [Actinocrinis sp.]|jgi:hypothetical protein|uniref:hypothetical protein n=1 Tax=Actinocrinis sp. TaxID=1920516 RepID=UPI002DDD8706|nr:hypothetical protein [Actinocrinis sp.]HEV3171844.1 hypothetical protein [Actinocrinis sp.]